MRQPPTIAVRRLEALETISETQLRQSMSMKKMGTERRSLHMGIATSAVNLIRTVHI